MPLICDLDRVAVRGGTPHRRADVEPVDLPGRHVGVEDDLAGAVGDQTWAPPRGLERHPGRRPAWRRCDGPPDPLSSDGASDGSSTGVSITSRAIDQPSTSTITAAISTDQFGPPRVQRMPPLEPVASSASNTRRGLIGASAYLSS